MGLLLAAIVLHRSCITSLARSRHQDCDSLSSAFRVFTPRCGMVWNQFAGKGIVVRLVSLVSMTATHVRDGDEKRGQDGSRRERDRQLGEQGSMKRLNCRFYCMEYITSVAAGLAEGSRWFVGCSESYPWCENGKSKIWVVTQAREVPASVRGQVELRSAGLEGVGQSA